MTKINLLKIVPLSFLFCIIIYCPAKPQINQIDTLNGTLTPGIHYYKQYASLQRQLNGTAYPVKDRKLYFCYTGEYNAGRLSYTIYDIHRNDVTPAIPQLQKQYGDNRYELPVPLLPPGVYTLEVTNEKSEKFFLRFELIN